MQQNIKTIMENQDKKNDFKCVFPECVDKEYHTHTTAGNVTSVDGISILSNIDKR